MTIAPKLFRDYVKQLSLYHKRVIGTPELAEINMDRAVELTKPFLPSSHLGRCAKMLLMALTKNQYTQDEMTLEQLQRQTLLTEKELSRAVAYLDERGLITIDGESVYLHIPKEMYADKR